MDNINCSAVIVAGGMGRRMKSKTEKQFLMLSGEEILIHTVKNISKSKYIKEITVVTVSDKIDYTKKLLSAFPKVKNIVSGGETRAQSVKNGLSAVSENCEIVLIHDGVRPFIEEKFTNNCIEDAFKFGSAVLGVIPTNTIYVTDEQGNIKETLKRNSLVSVQTPQCFKREIIMEAYDKFSPMCTDDASQVIRLGKTVHITEGSSQNIKITVPEDMIIAQEYIKDFG